MAYRLILGREPEGPEVIGRHARTHPSLQAMRLRFMQSAEFQRVLGREPADQPPSVIRPWNQPAQHIETNVAAELADRLAAHVEQVWTRLGQTEPHWSVLTHEAFRSGQIGQNERAFFDSGETPAAMFLQALARARIDADLLAGQTCFELGCGVGRITLQLARHFERVIAADISPAHLALAQQALAAADRTNVELVHLTGVRLVGRLPRVDAFVSIIVLQHNPPPLMQLLLELCLQRLRPGGVGYFQLPYYIPGYSFTVADYLQRIAQPDAAAEMEMHALPQPVVFDVVARAGCRVLELREDSWCGEGINSCSLLVQRI